MLRLEITVEIALGFRDHPSITIVDSLSRLKQNFG